MAENKTQELTFLEKVKEMLIKNHNIILHGAPGTGKTYLACEIAKVMCEDQDIKKLEESGQFKMVQFHPSYDYTDFVEGLRPTDKNEKGEVVKDIHFVRTDGIFKAFCKKAVISMDNLETVSTQSTEDSVATEEFDINKCWELLIQDILSDKVTKFKLKTGFYTTPIDIQTQKSRKNNKIVYFTKLDGNSKGNTVTFANIQKLSQTFQNKESLSSIQTLQPVRDAIGVGCDDSKCWAVLNYIYENYKCNKKIDTIDNFTTITPFIFLIDEINRGDMSKIFGELFFSIDPGYRGEDRKIPTQYQNLVNEEDDPFYKGFYIPKNVYIIGTMNDIDRSVESMDFAMRRRFQFVEVKPEHRADDMGVKKDSEAHKRMTSLNNCISGKVEDGGIGLSTAYHIGPSYFMKLAKGEESVIDLWNYRLEGLLREYLRGEDESEAKAKLGKLKKAFGIKTENGVDLVMPV